VGHGHAFQGAAAGGSAPGIYPAETVGLPRVFSGRANIVPLEGKAYRPYVRLSWNEAAAMSTLTVTAKGQVTLRKDVLAHLGVRPGDKIVVETRPDGRIEMKAARPTGRISDVFGCLKRPDGPSLSIEEITAAAARGWAGDR
jgi:AbrB family looped-hinge helix DNA binding protein